MEQHVINGYVNSSLERFCNEARIIPIEILNMTISWPTQLYFPSVHNCVTLPCDEPVDISLICFQECIIFFLVLPKCTASVEVKRY